MILRFSAGCWSCWAWRGPEIDRKFGFLLEALASGAPPHGGIALGMDRIVKDFLRAASLRDVIAFPKTTAARALFEGAPTRVSPSDLKALHLRPIEADPGSEPKPELGRGR